MSVDATINTPVAFQQGGKVLQIGSGGDVEYNGVALGAVVGISVAPGASTIALVTFQVKDQRGNSLAKVFPLTIWLSDAATGDGLTAGAASGNVVAGTAGTLIGTLTSKKALSVLTDATGKFILSITDTGTHHYYPAAIAPGTGQVQVGAQLADASYGT
jgi:hypothetical protein